MLKKAALIGAILYAMQALVGIAIGVSTVMLNKDDAIHYVKELTRG